MSPTLIYPYEFVQLQAHSHTHIAGLSAGLLGAVATTYLLCIISSQGWSILGREELGDQAALRFRTVAEAGEIYGGRVSGEDGSP